MLHEQIEKDMLAAFKSSDKIRTGVLRFLISALKNFQIEKKIRDKKFLPDEDVVSIVMRQVKQRKDSISEYGKGGRADLAEKEGQELKILESYLPAQLSEEDIRRVVKEKMSTLDVSDRSGFGKLMGAVIKELKGQAEGNLVKKIVEEEMNGS